MQRRQSDFLWVHVVLQVRDGQDSNQQSVIVCTNQVLSDREASVMLSNSWLYHYYTVQSKMQFGIPFEGATRIPPTAPYYTAPAGHSLSPNSAAGVGNVSGTIAGTSLGGSGIGGGGLQPHGYSTPHHSHVPAYGYHSPSGQHHNGGGGAVTPMLHGHHHHHQHVVQQGGGLTAAGDAGEYGTRPYEFRLDASGQPVDYSGGHPTPPTSAPPTMAGIPMPVVQVTPHIRCHNGGGGAGPSSGNSGASGGNSSNSNTNGSNNSSTGNSGSSHVTTNGGSDRHMGTPPAKKRNMNRLEPLYIPDNGQSDSTETSVIGELQSSGAGNPAGLHPQDGGVSAVSNGLSHLNGSLDGGVNVTPAGGGGGGGGLQTMIIGSVPSGRTAIGRLHSKSALLPSTVSSLASEPTDFMEQWNPSPPWSDTTAQKVPDITHQELSPYMTTTPPTPTSAPHQLLNGGFPTATTFSFDWMPEQFVPIVSDCSGSALLPPGAMAVSHVVSGAPTITSTNSTATGTAGCVLPVPSCLTQDGLPIPGLPIPMPVPLQIPPPPWPSDHRLLALDGNGGPSATPTSSDGGRERKPAEDSTGHQDQRRSH
uniref:Uncharacterized protein n=1 Tax=Anopheles atroparvus TaxID=41427 RepID=A0AAG5CY70_ANOAO